MVIAQKNQIAACSDHIKRNTERFRPREPVSAHTHFAGFVLAILGMPVLLIRAARHTDDLSALIGIAVFAFSMVLLYGASAAYHSFNISKRADLALKKIDHMSIFVLIAGSYTPVCLTVLRGASGKHLLIAIWTLALAGIVFKAFFVHCPKWVSSVTYVAMGWAALAVVGKLWQVLPRAGFFWLLAEGFFYTAGAVIYAIRPHAFGNAWFGNHELFHCFVLAGSLCHFILVFFFLA